MRASFYYDGYHISVADKIKDYLNSVSIGLTNQTANSVRAVGDIIQSLVSERFDTFLGEWCAEYSKDFPRRAMPDFAFVDKEGFYTAVDVKTHRIDTKFNMPNLTSVARLMKFYESDKNVFSVLIVKYTITEDVKLDVTGVDFIPIEYLDWECLTIGALGQGQIQIANSNRIKIVDKYSRKKWVLQLCEVMFGFYPNEILKIRGRIERFREIKEKWEGKQDVWS